MTQTQFKPPLKMDPSYFVDAWMEADFVSVGKIVIVRHLGNRVFAFAQEYNANGKNLYLAKILSYKTFSGTNGRGFIVQTTVGEIKLLASEYLHFVKMDFFN